MKVFTRARAMGTSRTHRARDLEPPVIEDQGQVARVVPRAAELDDPQAALDLEVGDEMLAEMDDAVREEVLVPAALDDVAADDPVGTLRDHDARDVEVPQPFEEAEDLAAAVREL